MKKYLDITKRRIIANKFCQFLGTSLYRRSTVVQKEKKTQNLPVLNFRVRSQLVLRARFQN